MPFEWDSTVYNHALSLPLSLVKTLLIDKMGEAGVDENDQIIVANAFQSFEEVDHCTTLGIFNNLLKKFESIPSTHFSDCNEFFKALREESLAHGIRKTVYAKSSFCERMKRIKLKIKGADQRVGLSDFATPPNNKRYDKIFKEYISTQISIMCGSVNMFLPYIDLSYARGLINAYMDATENKSAYHGLIFEKAILSAKPSETLDSYDYDDNSSSVVKNPEIPLAVAQNLNNLVTPEERQNSIGYFNNSHNPIEGEFDHPCLLLPEFEKFKTENKIDTSLIDSAFASNQPNPLPRDGRVEKFETFFDNNIKNCRFLFSEGLKCRMYHKKSSFGKDRSLDHDYFDSGFVPSGRSMHGVPPTPRSHVPRTPSRPSEPRRPEETGDFRHRQPRGDSRPSHTSGSSWDQDIDQWGRAGESRDEPLSMFSPRRTENRLMNLVFYVFYSISWIALKIFELHEGFWDAIFGDADESRIRRVIFFVSLLYMFPVILTLVVCHYLGFNESGFRD